MRVFAISDLHLGAGVDKPMDVFGPGWRNHAGKIHSNWRETVSEKDLVLLPGDLSWAMRLEEAREDLEFIQSLPGYKVFLRGNHDFWFSSPARVRAVLGEGMQLVRFDACLYNGIGICGVRGWPWPGYGEYEEERDRRLYRREIERLRLSLGELSKLPFEIACAMMHYPPLTPQRLSAFCSLLRSAGVKWVVYGHIHGAGPGEAAEGCYDGVNYLCVSADNVGFRPRMMFEV